MIVRVAVVVRFGLGGPFGLGLGGESPDSVADVAGGAAGVDALGGFLLISGPLSKTLKCFNIVFKSSKSI